MIQGVGVNRAVRYGSPNNFVLLHIQKMICHLDTLFFILEVLEWLLLCFPASALDIIFGTLSLFLNITPIQSLEIIAVSTS